MKIYFKRAKQQRHLKLNTLLRLNRDFTITPRGGHKLICSKSFYFPFPLVYISRWETDHVVELRLYVPTTIFVE